MSGLLPSAALHSCFWFFSFIGANNLNTSFYTCYTPCGWQIGSLAWEDLSCRNQCTSQTFVFFLCSFATAVAVVVVNPYPLGQKGFNRPLNGTHNVSLSWATDPVSPFRCCSANHSTRSHVRTDRLHWPDARVWWTIIMG